MIQKRMSSGEYRHRVKMAKEAVKPFVDAYAEFYNTRLPEIILHASGRLETRYSDEDKTIMAQCQQQIEDMFRLAVGGEFPERIGVEMPGEGG